MAQYTVFEDRRAPGLHCGLKNLLADQTVKDVVIIFMKTVATNASMVDTYAFSFGVFAHDSAGGP